MWKIKHVYEKVKRKHIQIAVVKRCTSKCSSEYGLIKLSDDNSTFNVSTWPFSYGTYLILAGGLKTYCIGEWLMCALWGNEIPTYAVSVVWERQEPLLLNKWFNCNPELFLTTPSWMSVTHVYGLMTCLFALFRTYFILIYRVEKLSWKWRLLHVLIMFNLPLC